MKRVLITGIGGFLGMNLAKELFSKYEVCGVDKEEACPALFDVEKIDVTDAKKLADHVSRKKPDVVIHCAALANVDACELFPGKARLVNVVGTENAAEAARKAGAKLVYISTDQVFDGRKGMYSEEDGTGPVNVYGATKLEGEKAVLVSSEKNTVLRTNFYGWSDGKTLTFAEWILDAARKGKRITLFDDFVFSPLYVGNLIAVIKEAMEKDISGVYHVSSPDACTKYDFGMTLLDSFGMNEAKANVEKGSVGKAKLAAERPRDVSLFNGKMKKAVETKLMDIKEGIGCFNSSGKGWLK